MALENAEAGESRQSGGHIGEHNSIMPQRFTTCRLVGLALVILASVVLSVYAGDRLHYLDESDYEQGARSILHRHAYTDGSGQPTMARPPGYPAVIAVIYAAVEQPVAARVANAFFLMLAVLALGVLARRLEPRAAVLVPYLVLAYPLVLYASSLLYPQTLGCLLLTVIVLLVTGERFRAREAITTGILYAILILAIPYFLALLPLFAAFVVFGRTEPRWRSLRLATLMVVAAALLVLPWTVRNYLTFHVIVPVSANNGTNLFIGNSPATTPNSGITANVVPLCKAVHSGMTEYGYDSAMRQCAVDWITQNPAAAARLYVGKVLNYFNYRNEMATAGESVRWRDGLSFLTYYPLLLITLVRLALARRYPVSRTELLVCGLYFLNALASALFFTRLRFRIPFDFLLIAVNAAFLMRCLGARAALPVHRADERAAV
jgi:hypothetical protein